MSLRSELNNLIQERVYLPYEEMVRFCIEAGYKVSNAERRLRHSESPNIAPEMAKSKRGTDYIRGYRWKNVGERIPIRGLVADEKVIFRPEYSRSKKLEMAKLI